MCTIVHRVVQEQLCLTFTSSNICTSIRKRVSKIEFMIYYDISFFLLLTFGKIVFNINVCHSSMLSHDIRTRDLLHTIYQIFQYRRLKITLNGKCKKSTLNKICKKSTLNKIGNKITLNKICKIEI